MFGRSDKGMRLTTSSERMPVESGLDANFDRFVRRLASERVRRRAGPPRGWADGHGNLCPLPADDGTTRRHALVASSAAVATVTLWPWLRAMPARAQASCDTSASVLKCLADVERTEAAAVHSCLADQPADASVPSHWRWFIAAACTEAAVASAKLSRVACYAHACQSGDECCGGICCERSRCEVCSGDAETGSCRSACSPGRVCIDGDCRCPTSGGKPALDCHDYCCDVDNCEICGGVLGCLDKCQGGRECDGSGNCVCPAGRFECGPICCSACQTCDQSDAITTCKPSCPCGGQCDLASGICRPPPCGPCESCVDGRCVPSCGSCETCDHGVCRACSPDCETCVDGVCESTCSGCAHCDAGTGTCAEGCHGCEFCENSACVRFACEPPECWHPSADPDAPPVNGFSGCCVYACQRAETCDSVHGCQA